MSTWAVVVHYADAAATRRTVDMLSTGSVAPETVIVVDNRGDYESSSKDAGNDPPRALVLRPGRNIGFAAGANLGMRAALSEKADWIWLVNDDAEPRPDCLARLLHAGAEEPTAGLLSPVITYPEGEVWYAGGEVDERTFATGHRTSQLDGTTPFETGYATGCALLVRAEVLTQCGILDESLFMYLEDVELSLRARRAGWRLLVVPDAQVRHEVPRRGGRRVFSPLAEYLIVRNRLLLAARSSNIARALPSALSWAFRQAVKGANRGTLHADVRALGWGLMHGVSGRSGWPPPSVWRQS